MLWVLAVIVVGLIAVLAELLLHYQKRAHQLRLKQDPVHRAIRSHAQAMREASGRIQLIAANQVEELELGLNDMTRQIEAFGSRLRTHEKLVFGEGYDPRAPKQAKPPEEEIAPHEGEPKPVEKDPREALAETARQEQSELEGHRTGLVRDLEVIKRTLKLLDAKLHRSQAQAGPDKEGR